MMLHPQLMVTPVALALLWWLMTAGSPGSWLVGIPAIAAATWAAGSFSKGGRNRVSVIGMLRLLPIFLWESLRGGIDVARRTLTPRLRVSPGYTQYRTALRGPGARILFTNFVCLLPGTLAADLHDDCLELHLLDADLDPEAELRRLEKAIARAYRENGRDPEAAQ